jgi:hypothetical protein
MKRGQMKDPRRIAMGNRVKLLPPEERGLLFRMIDEANDSEIGRDAYIKAQMESGSPEFERIFEKILPESWFMQ